MNRILDPPLIDAPVEKPQRYQFTPRLKSLDIPPLLMKQQETLLPSSKIRNFTRLRDVQEEEEEEEEEEGGGG